MKSVPRYLVAMAFLLAGCGGGPRESDLQRYPIIPLPAQLDARPGAFLLTPDTRIALEPTEDRELRSSVERWAQSVRAASGLPLTIVRPGEEPSGSLIRVLLEHAGEGASEPAPQERYPGTALEAYSLRVTPDEVTLEARGRAGIFYGLGTISQLMPAMSGSSDTELMARRVEAAGLRFPWSVPAAEIKDEPRFPYRGVHLDVGRHFFGVEFIKRYIDLMASYRMNVFHWHLTEDQGWRLEIERYPRLTEVGSCRAETELPPGPGLVRLRRGDGIAHCGFYTQEEAREIVEYAAERFITVIPAIEMPGHSTAALAAYPELACTDGPFEVSPRWGVHRDILCPKEGTFTFLEGVLTEVMGIFPSRYVIVPGDEVPTIRWEESEVAQEVIRREGLGDEVQLKGWFTGRIQDFLERNGRYVLGGDDGRYGAVSPSAAVLASGHWAVDAARAGRDVIMISRSHLFLDHYQGDPLQEPPALRYYTPLEEVYGYEPVPMGLEPGKADRILGAQGMVWTELMPTPDHVEYMVLPRLLAVSEALWSPAEARQWQGFTSRLSSHLGRLDEQGYNLRIPDVLGLERDRLTLAPEIDIRLSAPMEGGAVLYTTDGSDPGPGDALLEHPLTLAVDEVGVEIAARIQLPDGRLGPTRRARYRRAALSDALVVADSVRRPGLTARFVSGYFPSVDRFLSSEDAAGVTEAVLGEAEWAAHTPTVSLPENLPSRSFVLILEGLIRVPDSGIYTFYLTSEDGGRVDIADHLVVDQASPHRDDDGQWDAGAMDTDAGEVALEAGWHPLRVTYLWGGGSPRLRLELEGPNLTRRVVPASWLAHRGPGGH